MFPKIREIFHKINPGVLSLIQHAIGLIFITARSFLHTNAATRVTIFAISIF